jgi:Fe-S cluster assembly protein SufD
LYKGILDEKAAGVFNGKIFVRPDAQKTNAIQSNNCILLSDQATIDTKPQLEIFADDVKCTHGATVGQLNEDAYFYMRSRGIEKSNARKLLIYAFASEVIDKINFEPVREKVLELFSDKLRTMKPE